MKSDRAVHCGKRASSPKVEAEPTAAHLDLWGQVSELGRLVKEAYGEAHPLHHIFRQAAQRDDEVPPLKNLEAARDAFRDLPEEEQRRLAHGWAIDWDRPTLEECCNRCDRSIQEELVFFMRPRHPHNSTALREWLADDTLHTVTIQIPLGTRKAEALVALAEARRMIEERWPELITSDGPHNIYSPSPQPDAPTAAPFPMELFKDLLLRYLRECVNVDPDDVRRASESGRASIDVGYSSDNGGENFSVISWDMAALLLGDAAEDGENEPETKGGDDA